MAKVPKFYLYGESDPQIEDAIQPRIALRKWDDLEIKEKQVAFQYIINRGWLDSHSEQIFEAIEYLNEFFLRQCPGKRLHNIKPEYDYGYGRSNEFERMDAAFLDFQDIFLNEKSEAMVLRMLSRFAQSHIDDSYLEMAKKAKGEQKKNISKKHSKNLIA